MTDEAINSLNFSDIELLKRDKKAWAKRMREFAYHEAGHAVFFLLIGPRSDLHFIGMETNESTLPFVRHVDRYDWRFAAAMQKHGKLEEARMWAANAVFLSLSGPCAESKFCRGDHSWTVWLQSMLDEDEESGTDLAKCKMLLSVMGYSERKQISCLKMIARWADEVMEIPRVWNAVTRLAEKLITVEQLDNEATFRELDAGAEHDSNQPMLVSMSRKWKRRFSTRFNNYS